MSIIASIDMNSSPWQAPGTAAAPQWIRARLGGGEGADQFSEDGLRFVDGQKGQLTVIDHYEHL